MTQKYTRVHSDTEKSFYAHIEDLGGEEKCDNKYDNIGYYSPSPDKHV